MQNINFLKDRVAYILEIAKEMQFMIERIYIYIYTLTQDLSNAADDSAKITAETRDYHR